MTSSLASHDLDSTSLTCELPDTVISELPGIPSEELVRNSVCHPAELSGTIQSRTAEDSLNQNEEIISSRVSGHAYQQKTLPPLYNISESSVATIVLAEMQAILVNLHALCHTRDDEPFFPVSYTVHFGERFVAVLTAFRGVSAASITKGFFPQQSDKVQLIY